MRLCMILMSIRVSERDLLCVINNVCVIECIYVIKCCVCDRNSIPRIRRLRKCAFVGIMQVSNTCSSSIGMLSAWDSLNLGENLAGN